MYHYYSKLLSVYPCSINGNPNNNLESLCISLFYSFIYIYISAQVPTQPLIQWVPEVKRPEPEADHSPPSSAEMKNGGAIPPFPLVFIVKCLVD
jgi:hypothetical protein